MWIYFIEQVWNYNNEYYISHLVEEATKKTWGMWSENLTTLNCYPKPYMVEGNDYIDY